MSLKPPESKGVNIEVVYALPERQQVISLTLDGVTCARDVLLRVLQEGLITLSEPDQALEPAELPIGVYGQVVPDDYVLSDGDRLEIYRPLVQDPMERRRREARSGKAGPL